jgi:DNA-binding NarL/FixJ family response regulator
MRSQARMKLSMQAHPFTNARRTAYNLRYLLAQGIAGLSQGNCLYSKWSETHMSTAARITKHRAKALSSDPVLPPRKRRPEALTTREQEILELIWTGFKNKEIAQRLKISVKTVEAHRANMMKKIRVSNTAQLLKAAIQGKMLKLR